MADIQSIAVPRMGLQTALDVAVAPKAAFSRLRGAPTWVWAFLISTALGVVASIGIAPATGHALGVELPAKLAADPRFAALPAAARQAQIAQISSFTQIAVRFSFIGVPFLLALGCAVRALVMLVANAIGKGDGTFTRFWALSVNVAVVGSGLSSIALLLIVLIRGVDAFDSANAIANAIPGLGMLVPPSAKAAAAFFGVFNVFAIWDVVLLALGMTIVARVSRATAIVTAVLILFATGLVPLVAATMQR